MVASCSKLSSVPLKKFWTNSKCRMSAILLTSSEGSVCVRVEQSGFLKSYWLCVLLRFSQETPKMSQSQLCLLGLRRVSLRVSKYLILYIREMVKCYTSWELSEI
jgi:hypothetical protein